MVWYKQKMSEKTKKDLVNDIKYLQQAITALAELNQQYQTVLENVGVAIFIIEEDTTISFVNTEFEKLSGYSKNEIEGKKKWTEFFTEEDVSRMLCYHYQRRIDPKGAPRSYEACFIDRRGQKKDVFLTVSMIPKTKKSVASLIDVTPFKQAQQEKERLQHQLFQAQRMEAIGKLAGGIAHDFNNLLTVIIGYIGLLLIQLKPNDSLYKAVEEIKKAAERAASLTRQLLAFSRRQILEPRVICVNNLVKDMKGMLRRVIGENIEVQTILEPNLLSIKADPTQIEQVIMNLVINARDAMPEGGKIIIRTKNVYIDEDYCRTYPYARTGNFVCLEVEDTGIGMDKETIQHIFEPFFTTKPAGIGTGLGLSVVYGVVKQHNGWINVYSEPGKGTIFKIFLPVVSEKPEKEEGKEEMPAGSLKGNGERILVVEDEKGLREMVKKILTENGYVVFEANNVKEASEIFNKEKGNFDLLFSDIVLPDSNGLEMAERFVKINPDLKILFTTGYTDERSQVVQVRKKGFRFLQKPYQLIELLTTVKHLLGQ